MYLQPVHFAANLLDPRYKGNKLSDDDISSAFDCIRTQAGHSDLDIARILSNLAEFRTSTGLWKRSYLWDSTKHTDPATWWKGLCTNQPLTPVAIRLLEVPPTSAACERIWSGFGNIHTKKRNRLTNKHVEKLVAIHSNLKLRSSASQRPETNSSSGSDESNSDT